MTSSLFNFTKKNPISKKKSIQILDTYSFSQNALYLKAKLTGKKRHIARAALSSFHYKSLAFCLGKLKPEKADKEIESVDIVTIMSPIVKKDTSSKKSQKLNKTSKVKKSKKIKKSELVGEYVSDGQNVMDSAISGAGTNKTVRVETTGELKKIKAPASKNKNKRNWTDMSLESYKKPIKLNDYTKWLNRINKEDALEIKQIITEPKKTKKKETFKTKINKSVIINEAIVSEPLADLLYSQGHLNEAINMYEKLSLIFPEKSSFFADKIKALKK